MRVRVVDPADMEDVQAEICRKLEHIGTGDSGSGKRGQSHRAYSERKPGDDVDH